MSGKYDDIIHLPRPVSRKHPPMSLQNRAAQFSPFAALTGFNAEISETGRLTEQRIELDESEKAVLNGKLTGIQARLNSHPIATITYFQPDAKKEGGAYISATGTVKKIDAFLRMVIMAGGERIPIDDIIAISEESGQYGDQGIE